MQLKAHNILDIDSGRIEGLSSELLEIKSGEPENEIVSRKSPTSLSKSSSNPSNKTLKVKPSKQSKTRKQKSMMKVKSVSKKNVLKYIDEFKSKGIHYMEELNEDEIMGIIAHARKMYYNNKPIMTDNEFDIVYEYATEKYPDNTVLSDVGAPIETKNKVTLPYFMGSMDKIKPTTDSLDKWKTKYSGNYVISAKLDGVSGLYSTEGGKQKLYTRGNGTVGQDVSHLIPYLTLPIKENITIRGEFIISKFMFNTLYKDEFSNPRNFVAGVINSKKVNKQRMEHIQFIAYEVIVPEMLPSAQIDFLTGLQVNTVLNDYENDIDNKLLSTYLTNWRNSYMYEIDGIIVTHDALYPRKKGNPDHAFAFKMVLTNQIAEAKVVDVLWNASKDGYLKPKIQIEPITIGGVKIEYATAFNANFVVTNEIGVGAIVRMIRSGDVIPYIESVVQPATTIKMPDEPYYWNDTHVDIILQDPHQNQDVLLKNITGFFTILDVKQLSKGNVKRIMDSGYQSVAAILKMNEDDFMNVDGFKEKTASNLYNGIKTSVEKASLAKLMSASNVFGHGFAVKKFELILNAYPSILNENMSDQIMIERLIGVQGIAEKTAHAFVKHIQPFKQFMKDCHLLSKISQEAPTQMVSLSEINTSHELYEKKVLLTGFRDKMLSDELQSAYHVDIQSTVNSKTFAVIVKDMETDNAKTVKAKKMNIPIYTRDDFVKKYMNNK